MLADHHDVSGRNRLWFPKTSKVLFKVQVQTEPLILSWNGFTGHSLIDDPNRNSNCISTQLTVLVL